MWYFRQQFDTTIRICIYNARLESAVCAAVDRMNTVKSTAWIGWVERGGTRDGYSKRKITFAWKKKKKKIPSIYTYGIYDVYDDRFFFFYAIPFLFPLLDFFPL